MSTIVLTFGTFDLFHVGHLNILRRAREFGKLWVGVSTDKFNEEKGKKCVIPFEQRKEIIGSLRCVDFVFAEESWEQKQKCVDYLFERGANVIVIMGDDWKGKFDSLERCSVIYLPRTEGVSTTEIKNKVRISGD